MNDRHSEDIEAIKMEFLNIKADKLNPIREVIANELDKVVGTNPNIKLDDATKNKIKGQFNRVAKILGGLNG